MIYRKSFHDRIIKKKNFNVCVCMFDHDSDRELLLLQINYIPFWAPQPQALIHTLTLCNFLSFVYHNNCYRPNYMKMVFQKGIVQGISIFQECSN